MADVSGVWVKVYPDAAGPGLPGLGGWADVTTVTGDSGNRYTYTDADGDWVAYEWAGPAQSPGGGGLTTTGGLVSCLIVSSGVAHPYAACASVTDAELFLPAGELDISVGYAVGNSAEGTASDTRITPKGVTDLQRQIVINSGYTAYFDGNTGRTPNGQYSSITGTELLYGHVPVSWPAGDIPPGWGGLSGKNTGGAVIIRVPAANALATIPGTWGDL